MRQLPLAVWLTLLSLGLVLLVVAGLVPAGLTLLQRLASENARTRVQLAAVGAVEGVHRHAEEARIAASLLAERPTLVRYLEAGASAELATFLERFRATSSLHGCAVLSRGVVVAAAPPELPWAELLATTGQGVRYRPPLDAECAGVVVADAPLLGHPEGHAVVLRRLDALLSRRLEEQVGLPVRLVAALRHGDLEPSFRDGAWHAARPLVVEGSAGGEAIGVEVTLDARVVARSLTPLQRTFAGVTIAAAVVAVAAGILAARQLARPLQVLESSARRIGKGDLATPVPAAQGAEAGALAASMDEMRRRLRSTTDELRHREAEAKALLEGIVEGVFAVDGDRRIQYLNPQAAARLGVTEEEVRGRFCGDVLRPLDRDGARPCDSACPIVHARSRGSSRAVEHLQLPGGRRTVVITSAPPDGSKQVQVMRDETEIEAARRARDAVLANVSHELKTPLSAQLASIELLRTELEEAGSPGEGESLQLVGSLERSTLRLTRLIDNLLESVRIETGQATFRRVVVQLDAVIEDAASMTLPLLVQRAQRLELDLPVPPAEVEGDPGQLAQVFVNLLANANKFAPEGSTIRVGAERRNRTLCSWVQDEGPGVPAPGSLFRRFQRAGASVEGMGLGLWIVKAIVERHGGSVAVDATVRTGARFLVRLPLRGTA